MKKVKLLVCGCIALIFFACQPSNTPEKKTENAPLPTSDGKTLSPDAQYGALFEAVQMGGVFPDSKTFADCAPKFEPSQILKKYESEKSDKGFDLKKFVLDNFDPPVPHNSGFQADLARSPEAHINALWDVLTRKGDTPGAPGTLLPLPKPYVVRGGRFDDIFYWDSYFTMLGLQSAGRRDLIESMVDNFAQLIDTYGHIPNGNRSYHLGRSQPPFFSMMVRLLDNMAPDKKSPEAPLAKYFPQMEKEYAFWMDGADKLTEDFTAQRRVVRAGYGVMMNRYWDDSPGPRPEAWKEDVETAKKHPERPKEEIYRHLRAGAESGWDFSSRWGISNKDMGSINTADIIPIDLNCLMLHLESALSEGAQRRGEEKKMQRYGKAAYERGRFIRQFFYDPNAGWFGDFNWVDKNLTGNLSLAGMFPLWMEIADKHQADAAAKTLETKFLRPGGLVCTPTRTGQQWDAPNGWAPLQWVAIEGLRKNNHAALATTVKKRWVDLCVNVYKRTGKMLEKYNVEDLSREDGGGEYPAQDGFGWTNGVLLKLLSEK